MVAFLMVRRHRYIAGVGNHVADHVVTVSPINGLPVSLRRRVQRLESRRAGSNTGWRD